MSNDKCLALNKSNPYFDKVLNHSNLRKFDRSPILENHSHSYASEHRALSFLNTRCLLVENLFKIMCIRFIILFTLLYFKIFLQIPIKYHLLCAKV